VSCRSSDTLSVAAQAMWEHDCGAIPVADDGRRLIGIITGRDICHGDLHPKQSPSDALGCGRAGEVSDVVPCGRIRQMSPKAWCAREDPASTDCR
jgi:CBS-domain-containing membrane protein